MTEGKICDVCGNILENSNILNFHPDCIRSGLGFIERGCKVLKLNAEKKSKKCHICEKQIYNEIHILIDKNGYVPVFSHLTCTVKDIKERKNASCVIKNEEGFL